MEKCVAERFVELHKSEIIKKTLDPDWNSFTLPMGIEHEQLRVKCFDWDQNSSNDLIGEVTFTLNDVLHGTKSLELINPTKKKSKHSGIFEIEITITDIKYTIPNPALNICQQVIQLKQQSYFMDYIMGGCTIQVSVGIDFTGSNGQYHLISSKHYLSNNPNHYQKALMDLGAILEPYDPDKMYPGE